MDICEHCDGTNRALTETANGGPRARPCGHCIQGFSLDSEVVEALEKAAVGGEKI